MTSQAPDILIHIIFTAVDVEDIADDVDVDLDTAMQRSREWADALRDQAINNINEALASVIKYGTP